MTIFIAYKFIFIREKIKQFMGGALIFWFEKFRNNKMPEWRKEGNKSDLFGELSGLITGEQKS